MHLRDANSFDAAGGARCPMRRVKELNGVLTGGVATGAEMARPQPRPTARPSKRQKKFKSENVQERKSVLA